jgi:hypothetical protein
MPQPEIDFPQLRPFIAPVLLEAVGELQGQDLLRRVVNKSTELARASSNHVRRRIVRTTGIDEGDGLILQAVVYRETSRPAWAGTIALENEDHQLLVVAVRDKIVALSASDGTMRDRIVKECSAVRKMPRDAVAAFIGDEARALWLSGAHTPTASKADSKAITGIALEYAIDPIGDQTYYCAAARTVPDVAGLGKPADLKKPLVGAAPGNSRLWVRRATDWEDYRRVIGVIIDHALNGARPASPFAALAQPVEDVAEVAVAYGITIIPGELLSEDEIASADRERARRWAFDATFDVEPLPGLSLRVGVALDGQPIGTADLAVSMANGEAAITLTWSTTVAGKADERNECARYLGDPHQVKIFYESGHSIAQGHCYRGGYSDQPFEWDFRIFDGYEIHREKPVVPAGSTLAAQIATAGDTSLFAYVVQQMFLDDQGQPSGWLASDDGSMELADFIHIDPVKAIISLVHVKASSKTGDDRSAAPTDYEVVVAQAVKNLRHLDRRNLATELKKGKGRKIGAAVWHNGIKQPNRTPMLAAIQALPASASKVLIVLQPRVTKREHVRCRADGAAPSHAMRIRQIDTLMLAARASALACGASFVGIGDLAVP